MTLGAPYGIPVRLHPSFPVLMAGFVVWGFLEGGLAGAVVALGLVVGLAASVVLHELGHALAAKRFGIRTAHVTVYPWGGAAALERMPEDPDQEMIVALAGPAANFVVAAALGWVWWLWPNPLVWVLAVTNLALGALNLVPAYPMDGGRVLRAVLARRMGHGPASLAAMRLGHGFAVVGGALGLPLLVVGQWSMGLSLVATAVLLAVALRQEREQLVASFWQATAGSPPPWGAGTPSRGPSGPTASRSEHPPEHHPG